MEKFNYLPHTPEDRQLMLEAIGVKTQEDLFKQIPESLKNVKLGLPEGFSELEVENKLIELAKKNVTPRDFISFLGGGCNDRYIPAIVNEIISRPEFMTAYTPYQPEISQGTLQAIYEYQTMICSLTGMDVSNASMYDGATATAEAILMACRITKRNKIVLSRATDPEIQEVVRTYLSGPEINIEICPINLSEGMTDLDILEEITNKDIACVVVQMPNFFGNIEEVRKIEKIAHNNGALFVVNLDPISSGIIKTPGSYNTDIVVGDGQSLGCSMMYGGPGFGFMACKQKYMRQMPGRIIGATTDNKGKKAYTLTLQTREQHIRREKATSNICTNHSLCALGAAVYLSIMGPEGLKNVANICFQRAHYLANKINELGAFNVIYENFFNSFLLELPEELDPHNFIGKMTECGILPGISLSGYYNELPNSILVTVTETNTPAELYLFISSLKNLVDELGL